MKNNNINNKKWLELNDWLLIVRNWLLKYRKEIVYNTARNWLLKNKPNHSLLNKDKLKIK